MRVINLLLLATVLYAQRDAGIAAFNAGRYTEAMKDLSAAPKSDETAQLFLALSQAATGDCTAALPELTRTPLNKMAGVAAVNCYAGLNDAANEFNTLDQLEKRYPNDADVLYLSAKQHMKAFNDTTFAMFQRTPASYRVHELSADIFEVQNRFDEAISEYRKAIELNPNAPDLHYQLGRALLLQSHSPDVLEQAANEFKAELKLSPEDASCEFQLGQIAQVQTKTSEAKEHFEQALKVSPNFVQALIALGKLDKPRAIELLTRATSLEPDNEAAHYALLTAYRDSGQMDKAKAEKATLDRLQKPADGEFTDFLKKLGDK